MDLTVQLPSHTVVIPTLALAERADMLRRAIRSVFEGNSTVSDLVVVVNGARFAPELLVEISALPRVRVVRVEAPGSPGAILAGRKAVQTPFFSFLDDDDEYLPGAVDARLAVLHANPAADIVVSNGFRRSNGVDRQALQNLGQVSADPLRALFVENWMPSCGPAFRTETVPEAAFERLPRHIHWSFLAFTLAMMGKKVATVAQPCYIINDTLGSASKQETYLLCHIEIYERMLAADPPSDIREIVARRLGGALHEASDHFRIRRNLRDAWCMHLRSLGCSGGFRFIAYTRRLFLVRPSW